MIKLLPISCALPSIIQKYLNEIIDERGSRKYFKNRWSHFPRHSCTIDLNGHNGIKFINSTVCVYQYGACSVTII